MPFKSDKQRRYLWSQKPEVAKKFAEHHAEGGKARPWWAGPNTPDWMLTAGPLAAGFVPGVGEAMDAADAYDAWTAGDYAKAAGIAGIGALGLVPGVGDAIAGGARAARRAAPLAGTAVKHLDKDYAGLALDELRGINRPARSVGASAKFDEPVHGLTRKEEAAAELLGPDGRKIVADMKREAKDPSIATGENLGPLAKVRDRADPSYRGDGKHDLYYRRYQTPKGDYVHSTYDPYGNVQNVLGGTKRELERFKGPRTGWAKTVGGVDRPSGAFDLVTGKMRDAGDTRRRQKIQDAVAPLGPAKSGNPLIDSLKAKGYSDAQIAAIMKAQGG